MCKKYTLVKDMVCLFAELTHILQTMREKKGNISLDVKEAKIILENDEIKIPDYQREFSYQIIEAFMVLANETVAEYMHSIEAPFVYRIHEKPTEEKDSSPVHTIKHIFHLLITLVMRFSKAIQQKHKPSDASPRVFSFFGEGGEDKKNGEGGFSPSGAGIPGTKP
mgnify:CR=1 FL=1